MSRQHSGAEPGLLLATGSRLNLILFFKSGLLRPSAIDRLRSAPTSRRRLETLAFRAARLPLVPDAVRSLRNDLTQHGYRHRNRQASRPHL